MGEPLFVTWDENDKKAKAIAIALASQALAKTEPMLRASGSSVTIRDSFSRHDEDFRRPKERVLTLRPKEAIRRCMEAYDEFGIVRNAIDLMADFGCQGIDLAHPVEEVERFYKEWFRRVNGPERSERFLNYFYRTGHVFMRRLNGKLAPKEVDEYKRSTAGDNNQSLHTLPPSTPRELPAQYIFLNPLGIEVEGDAFATMLNPKDWKYYIWLNSEYWSDFRENRIFPSASPLQMSPFINVKNMQRIPLDNGNLAVFYYKRDDWNCWAKPLTYAILTDLNILRKLRMADDNALDSAISYIRLWKLGDIKNRILPTEAGLRKLAGMLAANIGGGGMDLVWGPELTLQETSTSPSAYLGEAKYVPVLAAIREGLGMPTPQPGHGNNYMNMKTLLERLQYGRARLREMWEYEIRLVQKAMTFKKPATLMFERMVLSDEAAEKALLIQLYDRSGLSLEAIQERFGECPEIEQVRLRREAKRRKQGRMPPQSGPWFDPQGQDKLKQMFVQQGHLTPGEVGVELQPRPKGQKSPQEVAIDAKKASDQAKVAGQPGKGRPKNKKDTKKRKKKRISPRTASLFVWADRAREQIHKLAAPAYLQACKKKSLRELTDDEQKKFESFKWAALNQVPAGLDVDDEVFAAILSREMPVAAPVDQLLEATLGELRANNGGRELTADQLRRAHSSVVALWRAGDDGDGNGDEGTVVAAPAGDNPDGSPALPRAVENIILD